MKVLSITPTFYPELGGLEQVVLELATRVRSFGVTMDVAHVARGLTESTDTVQGVRVFRMPLLGNRFVGWARSLGKLARGYDLLHVHDPQLLALTGNVRWRCAGIPAVLSTHGGFWHTSSNSMFKHAYESTLLKGYASHYRRILASSAGDYEYFSRFAARVALCSNGVPVKRFNKVAPPGPRSNLQWIYWGRLSRNKRLDLVIEYVDRSRKSGFPVELLVCGRDFDGLLSALKAQVARLGLEKAVTFTAYLDDTALMTELAQRGVYVTASEYEGFGLSIVEAMAAGLIVLCRDMAPVNGFFAHGESGWFLRFDGTAPDLESLRNFLRLPADKLEAMASAARLAAAVHDWDAVIPRFVGHYRDVLSERMVEAPS